MENVFMRFLSRDTNACSIDRPLLNVCKHTHTHNIHICICEWVWDGDMVNKRKVCAQTTVEKHKIAFKTSAICSGFSLWCHLSCEKSLSFIEGSGHQIAIATARLISFFFTNSTNTIDE